MCQFILSADGVVLCICICGSIVGLFSVLLTVSLNFNDFTSIPEYLVG
jgi:hypothetical protein